jgi:hypothetical protein
LKGEIKMKVIDISAKLTNEKPVVKISDDMELAVKNDKNTVLLVQQELSREDGRPDIVKFDAVMKLIVGEKAVKALDALELPFNDYTTVVKAVMAAATGEDYDTVDARFQ